MSDPQLYFEVFGSRVEFGWGALNTLGNHAARFAARRALVVTDADVANLGIPEQVAAVLKASGIESVVFKEVAPNPTDLNVAAGTTIFREAGCDLIVGVGGGSPMDAAKGIAVLAAHPAPLKTYYGLEGAAKITAPLPPLFAIPTTAGTGSETSRGAVITDTERKVKCLLRPGMPALALVDPSLTVDMPPRLTAATGMDALSHNIEAFLSPRYHPAAEAIALEGIRLVAENLAAAFEGGQNRTARTQMAMASSLGALAFQKGLGVTHSLSHQLSSEYGVHHGLGNAILLPHTMAYNLEAAQDKMTRIAFAMGATSPSPQAAVDAVAHLVDRVGLPARLSEVGVSRAGIAAMARNALEDWCHLTNPRPCKEADMRTIYQQAM
jgi:alcohol dehydrogenase class IV